MLKDSFGRIHDYLRISLTEKCNLRCTYCMPEEGVKLSPHSNLLTADEIIEMAKVFVELGVNKIRLTGGEPLLRKDVGEIMMNLSKLPVKLTMTTNAIFADKYLDTLKKSGIDSLNISLDTLQRDKFLQITKRDQYDKTMSNIDLLIREGFHVKVNVVMMRDFNEDEIIDFIDWTKDKNIHVRFIEFMPFDGNNWQWDNIISYDDILKRIGSRYRITKLKDKKNDTARAFKVNGHQGTFAIVSSMTNHFCNTCNRLRLTTDGKMKNCLFSNKEVDLLTPFRNGEDIKHIIEECLSLKKAKHGGIKQLSKLTYDNAQMSERSMILIGG